jgi:hypothetical protein
MTGSDGDGGGHGLGYYSGILTAETEENHEILRQASRCPCRNLNSADSKQRHYRGIILHAASCLREMKRPGCERTHMMSLDTRNSFTLVLLFRSCVESVLIAVWYRGPRTQLCNMSSQHTLCPSLAEVCSTHRFWCVTHT